MSFNTRVNNAISATRMLDCGDYWRKTLNSRLSEGSGSRTMFGDPVELEAALRNVDWRPYQHEAIGPDCVAFVCDLPGLLGVFPIIDTDRIRLSDPKGTGKICGEFIGGSMRMPHVGYTVIILGKEDGEEVVFTFHPGPPIRASEVEADPALVGRNVLGTFAKELGLVFAKV